MGIGMLTFTLLGIVFIVVMFYGIKALCFSSSEHALEILKRRYAKGEITEEQYRHMRNLLLEEEESED